jgi:hypothetical protein
MVAEKRRVPKSFPLLSKRQDGLGIWNLKGCIYKDTSCLIVPLIFQSYEMILHLINY